MYYNIYLLSTAFILILVVFSASAAATAADTDICKHTAKKPNKRNKFPFFFFLASTLAQNSFLFCIKKFRYFSVYNDNNNGNDVDDRVNDGDDDDDDNDNKKSTFPVMMMTMLTFIFAIFKICEQKGSINLSKS